MTDLGTLGGGHSYATAINNHGQVVGYTVGSDDGDHAFLWEDGVMVQLPSLGGDWSGATDITDAGTIVGASSATPGGDLRAVVWTRGSSRRFR